MALQAAPRQIGGTTYPDPIAYVVAGGFSADDARAYRSLLKAAGRDGAPVPAAR